MKKILQCTSGTLVILAVAVFLFRNAVLKIILETAVTGLTGFKTKIEALRYDLPATLQINGLRVYNPQGFKNSIFANAPEVYIDWSLGELLREKKIHIREIKLHIEEIHIEKNALGITNASRLSSAGGSVKKTEEGPSKKTIPPASQPTPFLLDRLELTLRTVSFEDHSAGRRVARAVVPEKISVDMKIEKQIFGNIRDPQALVNLVLLKIVYGTTFGNLIGIRPDNLRQALTGAFGSGRELVGEAAEVVTERTGRWAAGAADTAPQQAEGLLSSKSLTGAKSTLADASQATKRKFSGLVNKLKSNKDE